MSNKHWNEPENGSVMNKRWKEPEYNPVMTMLNKRWDEPEYDPVLDVLLDLQTRLSQGQLSNDAIKSDVDKAIVLTKEREAFCEKMTSTPTEALQSLEDNTNSHPFEEANAAGKTTVMLGAIMMSGRLEGQFLQSVVSMSKAKRVLEVGMFTGYGALACAEALPADGEVVTCELDPYLEQVAKSFFAKSPHGNKIQIRLGPAGDTLQQLAEERQQFDIIFIDANKDGYLQYYKTITEHGLLARGGTILVDNTLYFGLSYLPDSACQHFNQHKINNGKAIREFDTYIRSQTNMHKVMVPIRDGVLMIRRMEETRTEA